MADNEQMGAAPVEAKISPEMVEAAKQMIGVQLRPEGPYVQEASLDTMTNWCNGIGDLNPLYRDLEHGRKSRQGSIVAHPMFPMAYGWLGRTRWGFPGVHGFYAGNDWEYFRNVRQGDRISCIERIVGVQTKESKFSGTLAMQFVEGNFINQRDELVARVLGWCTRHERKAARDQGKYKEIVTHQYTDDELDTIQAAVLGERQTICGNNIRYFEDVNVGDQLTPIARGPLSMMDTMGFIVGCGRGHTHGILLEGAVKHPGHFFRNPEAGGGVEYTGIGHHRESTAKAVGVPGTYDYGPQRTAWISSVVTNWMGDAAFLKRFRAEMRRFNIMGDTTWCKGKVTQKYVKDGYALVDIEVWAENQRGELTAPGLATVMLPSKNLQNKIFFDGSKLDLELPMVR